MRVALEHESARTQPVPRKRRRSGGNDEQGGGFLPVHMTHHNGVRGVRNREFWLWRRLLDRLGEFFAGNFARREYPCRHVREHFSLGPPRNLF